ncbi:MAG TPA: SgcJ/EcaC family oxidoreductase [Gaiellaceae bacterium]|nr:SgcJ/EcaC family oxidoreductase [Gaiellaceae bacterium]
MKAQSPEQVIELFASAVSRGDVAGALTLYDPNATFAPQPGEWVRGVDAIRGALEQFAALKPTLTGEITKVVAAGDVALVMNRWQLTGTGPDGTPVAIAGHSADVVRQDADGGWRVLIDDPWGSS